MADDQAANVVANCGAMLSEVIEVSASTATGGPPPSSCRLANPDQAKVFELWPGNLEEVALLYGRNCPTS
jgi:hypothetical protein